MGQCYSCIDIQYLISRSNLQWVKQMSTHDCQKLIVQQQTKTTPQKYYYLKYDHDNYQQGIIFTNYYLYAGPIIAQMAIGSGIQTFMVKRNKQNIMFGKYQGQFVNNARHGKGVYEDQDMIFKGKWVHGFPVQGSLQMRSSRRASDVNMQFKISNLKFRETSMKSGYACVVFPDGSEYEGQIAIDEKGSFKMEGRGEIIMINRDVYRGGFKNGKFQGKGFYLQHESNVKYDGWYKNGLKDGLGILYVDHYNILEGRWREDKKQGVFILYKLQNDGSQQNLGEFKYKNDVLINHKIYQS